MQLFSILFIYVTGWGGIEQGGTYVAPPSPKPKLPGLFGVGELRVVGDGVWAYSQGFSSKMLAFTSASVTSSSLVPLLV